jgi:hypothetical protein
MVDWSVIADGLQQLVGFGMAVTDGTAQEHFSVQMWGGQLTFDQWRLVVS